MHALVMQREWKGCNGRDQREQAVARHRVLGYWERPSGQLELGGFDRLSHRQVQHDLLGAARDGVHSSTCTTFPARVSEQVLTVRRCFLELPS